MAGTFAHCKPPSGEALRIQIEAHPEWAVEPHGLPTLFVGGPFDGQMRRVLDFRDGSTPDGYHPVETWSQVAGVWARMDESGRLPGTTHRMEVAFAIGEPWTNARIMESMAAGLGTLYTYGKRGHKVGT